jgi:hypothetical protein
MNHSEDRGETVSRRKRAATFALRGAVGFGTGSVAAFLLMYAPKMLPFGWFTGPLLGFPLSGVIGGLALVWPIRGDCNPLTVAAGYGAGFTVAGVVLPISLVAESHGVSFWFITIPFHAIGFAIGLGIGAAIGTAFISFRLALIGAAAFAIGGLLGGTFLMPLFALVQLFLTIPPSSGDAVFFAVIFFEIFLSYAIGGALLGAAMGFLCDFD